MNAEFTSAWAAENYFRTELLMAVGQSFAFVGLVSTLILQSFFSGGLDSPSRVLTFSAFFHCVRIFGGQVGTTVMARFIAEQEKLHSYLVGLHVQSGDWITEHTVRLLTAGLAGQIDRHRGRRRPRGRTRRRRRSRAGLRAHLHRRVSPHGLGVGRDADPASRRSEDFR